MIILHSLLMRVLLESTTFLLHKIIKSVGTFRIAGIIKDHFQILIWFLVLYYFMGIQLHRMGAVDGDL